MAEPIAKIKLAPGNVGWYDSLTNIVLTKAQPEAVVYSGKNVINIKKAIREGKVLLQEGSLSSYENKATEEKKRDVKKNIPNKQDKETKKVKQETPKDIYKILSEKNDSDTKKSEDKKPVINKSKKEEAEPVVEVTKDTTKTTSNKKE